MFRLFIAALLAVCLSQTSFADTAANPHARDIKILTNWFEGEFDNEEQRWFEADPRSKTPEEAKIERIHTIHQRINAPEFGEHVFYVEEYASNDPANIIRQRLVIFSTDSGTIRMQQGFVKDAASWSASSGIPETISKDDVSFLDTCDVFWKRNAGQFEGRMNDKTCVFGKDDDRRYSVHNLTLSEDQYWRVDTTFLVSDDSLFKGYPVNTPIRMRRSKLFQCEVHYYGDVGAGQIDKNIPMHSQGGEIHTTRKGDGAPFEILMRDKQYPYYDTRPDFIYFSIRHGGEVRSIAFSVNDIDSRTLGMRTEEIGAFCHREGYEFQEQLLALQ